MTARLGNRPVSAAQRQRWEEQEAREGALLERVGAGDETARGELILGRRQWARARARRFAIGRYDDYQDDLEAEAMLTVTRVVQRMGPERYAADPEGFSIEVTHRVVEAMRRFATKYVMRVVGVHPNTEQRISQVIAVRDKLWQQFQREPTIDEVAERIKFRDRADAKKDLLRYLHKAQDRRSEAIDYREIAGRSWATRTRPGSA